MTRFSFAALGLCAALAAGCAAAAPVDAQAIGHVQSIDAALAKAKSLVEGGRVVALELDREHGRFVWETKVMTPQGARLKAEFDAVTLEPIALDGRDKGRHHRH